MRKSFPWEDLRQVSDTFSFIKATGRECGFYMGGEHPELKKKSPDLFLPICSFVRAFLLRLCAGKKKKEGLQSHKPTG